jgi:hypothetical protein
MIKNRITSRLGFNGIDSFISWGASVVIVGLMFKILHWNGGEFMIALGLIIEALLFLLLGFVKDQSDQREKESIENNISIQFTDMNEEVNQCKRELNKLGKNIEKLNSVFDGVIDSIKTNVNK